eukprot:226977-Pyramimonas_sp.AAC.1
MGRRRRKRRMKLRKKGEEKAEGKEAEKEVEVEEEGCVGEGGRKRRRRRRRRRRGTMRRRTGERRSSPSETIHRDQHHVDPDRVGKLPGEVTSLELLRVLASMGILSHDITAVSAAAA